MKALNKKLLSVLVLLLLPKKKSLMPKKVYEEVSVSLVCLTKQLLRSQADSHRKENAPN